MLAPAYVRCVLFMNASAAWAAIGDGCIDGSTAGGASKDCSASRFWFAPAYGACCGAPALAAGATPPMPPSGEAAMLLYVEGVGDERSSCPQLFMAAAPRGASKMPQLPRRQSNRSSKSGKGRNPDRANCRATFGRFGYVPQTGG